MRIRRLHYHVQDWNAVTPHFWWCKGDWRKNITPVGRGGACNQKSCRNLHNALKWARRLRAKGGVPLISRYITVKGRRKWRDFHLT